MYEYKVEQILDIHDGDTCSLFIDLGDSVYRKYHRCRLDGIDCPELRTVTPDGRHLGVEARDALVELLSRGPLRVQTLKDKHEKFGGLLVRLFVGLPDGTVLDVNSEMLRLGHGQPYKGERKALDQHTGQLKHP